MVKELLLIEVWQTMPAHDLLHSFASFSLIRFFFLAKLPIYQKNSPHLSQDIPYCSEMRHHFIIAGLLVESAVDFQAE